MNIIDAIKSGLQASDFDTMRGEFTQLPPRSRLASPTSTNPIARAHYAMLREIARLHVPQIDVSPVPEQFEDTSDYLLRFAVAVDRFLADVGAVVRENATSDVPAKDFENVVYNAVSDSCVRHINVAAEVCREGQDEDADADYRRDDFQELGHEG